MPFSLAAVIQSFLVLIFGYFLPGDQSVQGRPQPGVTIDTLKDGTIITANRLSKYKLFGNDSLVPTGEMSIQIPSNGGNVRHIFLPGFGDIDCKASALLYIRNYKEDSLIDIDVLDGKAIYKPTSISKKRRYYLKKDQGVRIDKWGIKVRKYLVYQLELGWITGYRGFDRLPIRAVLNMYQREYNCVIDIGDSYQKWVFTGAYFTDSIETKDKITSLETNLKSLCTELSYSNVHVCVKKIGERHYAIEPT